MQTKDNAQFHIVLISAWVEKDGKYLMAKRGRNEPQAPGTWSTPGGKMENEDGPDTVMNHLKKEVEEEVGIKVKDEMEFINSNSFTRVDNAHVVHFIFLCKWDSGEAKPLEDTEEVKWFTLEELKSAPLEKWKKREVESLERFLAKKQEILATNK